MGGKVCVAYFKQQNVAKGTLFSRGPGQPSVVLTLLCSAHNVPGTMKVRSLHLLGMTFDVVVHEGGLCIHLAATSVAGGRTGSKASKACSGAASARIVFYCLKNEILRSAQDDVNVLESTKVDFKANGIC